MKKLLLAGMALALSGCASMPVSRPQRHIMPTPAPVVQAAPPSIATPLVKPKWYDRFRQKNGRFFH